MVTFMGGGGFLPQISKVYSLEIMELVPNLASKACGGTEVYPGRFCGEYQGCCFLPCVSNIII